MNPHTSRIVDSPPTPGGKESPASTTVSAWAVPSTVSASDGRELLAGGASAGVGLGVGDLAVAVGVEVELRLERGDLGLVDDDVEEDPVGLDADPRVVVDREVAERVGGGQRGNEQHGGQADAGRPDRAVGVGGDARVGSREVGGDRAIHGCHRGASRMMPQDAAAADRPGVGRPPAVIRGQHPCG